MYVCVCDFEVEVQSLEKWFPTSSPMKKTTTHFIATEENFHEKKIDDRNS